MARIKRLTMGVDSPSGSLHDEEARLDTLRATVTHYLPDFARAVAAGRDGEPLDVIVIHQDAFAAGYHDDEYTLLGMAIKYAGLYNVRVIVSGKNHSTF